MEPWRWGPTSTTCCRPVSVLWGRSNPSSGLFRHTHWPLWSLPWYTVGLTTVMLYSLVSPTVTLSACNPFSTRPFVWSPARPGGTTLLVCFAIIIGFLSSSVPSTSCAWLHRCLHGEAPPNHAVCRSDCQSRSQIRHVWLCRSATYHVITRRPLVRCGCSACVEQAAVATSTLSNASWKQFYFPRLFSFWILDFAYC